MARPSLPRSQIALDTGVKSENAAQARAGNVPCCFPVRVLGCLLPVRPSSISLFELRAVAECFACCHFILI